VVAGFAEGCLWGEGLNEEEPEGALKGEDALAAVGAGGLWTEEMIWKEGGEEDLEFGSGSGAEGTKTAAERCEGVSKCGKKRGEHTSGTHTALLTMENENGYGREMKADLGAIYREYEKLKEQLSGIGWMSAGYVQDRGLGAGGPCYQWTRKEKGKTVSLALSKEQYEAMREAIEGWREVEAILDRMQQLTRLRIFGSLPDVRRRKPLTNKVLGVK
jgi:hypothetical protein